MQCVCVGGGGEEGVCVCVGGGCKEVMGGGEQYTKEMQYTDIH